MSNAAGPADVSPSIETATGRAPRRSLGRWLFPWFVLAGYFAVVTWAHYADVDGGVRFFTRFIASVVLLLFFAGWWLSQRSLRGRDRIVSGLLILLLLTGTTFLTHPSINVFNQLMSAFPWLCGLGLAWMGRSQGAASSRRAAGAVGLTAVVCGVMLLLRWDGVDGRQIGTYRWRWSPTAEERFLQSQASFGATARTEVPARAVVLQPGDWPGFRGSDRNGLVRHVNLQGWTGAAPRTVWTQKVGPGWSSFAVVDGLLFTQEQRGELELVVCYDASTGLERWKQSTPTRFDEALAGPGPRGTPTFADGRLFALGGNGDLHCLAADTGEVLWAQNVLTSSGGRVPQWGYSSSPLVVGGLVIVFAGGTDGRGLLALEADTGAIRWQSPAGEQSYASPHLVELDGVPQVVMHDNRALRGVRLIDGAPLWDVPVTNRTFLPMLQPHVVGARELVACSDDSGISLYEIRQETGNWKVEERWRSRGLKPSFNDFYVHKGHIYGLDNGILCCLSLTDGKRVWKGGRYEFGQLLLLPDADQLVVITEKSGQVVLVAADPREHRELATFAGVAGKTWNHAAFAGGRLYLRNSEEMACYDCQPDASSAGDRTGGTSVSETRLD